MINYRFLNYKHNTSFEQDLANNLIHDDAIAFILDKCYIWARGQKYICNGVGDATIDDGTLTFVDGNGQGIFTITQKDGTITITDSAGEQTSDTYVLKSIFDNTVYNLAKKGELGNYATLNQLNELSNSKQDKLTAGSHIKIQLNEVSCDINIDSKISSTSENPVQNKAIKKKLDEKADSSDLASYVLNETYSLAIGGKQDKLTAGNGIKITELNVIYTDLDTSVYVIVEELPHESEADPNKIYLLEARNPDDTYRYVQYRLRNGQWISFDMPMLSISLDDYLTIESAELTYQPIGDYLTSADLKDYAKSKDVEDLEDDLNDYVTYTYANETYQKKGDFVNKEYADATYVKYTDLYTPLNANDENVTPSDDENSTPGTSGVIINNYEIEIDKNLDLSSHRAVENRAITAELNTKPSKQEVADTYVSKEALNTRLGNYMTSELILSELTTKQGVLSPGDGIIIANNVISAIPTDLSNYATKSDLSTGLDKKQNTLTAGNGIVINGNEISTDLDTSVYVIVDTLPSVSEADPNKIYILESPTGNNTYRYIQYRLRNDQWVSFDAVMPDLGGALSDYLLSSVAEATYQPIGDYLTETSLSGYATLSDLDNYIREMNKYALSEWVSTNFATKKWVTDNYVNKTSVYTPSDGGGDNAAESSGEGQGSGGSGTGGSSNIVIYDIIVDPSLSFLSSNPVENKVVTAALDTKADKVVVQNTYATKTALDRKADLSALNDYALADNVATALQGKQDVLIPGRGIQIVDNEISSTLDTEAFIIVSELPVTNQNSNKIYLLEEINNGEYSYTEYRWVNNDWVLVGQRTPQIDLSNYLLSTTAASTYQPKGNYLTAQNLIPYYTKVEVDAVDDATRDWVEENYVTSDVLAGYNYIDSATLNVFKAQVDNKFNGYQTKGNYVLSTTFDSTIETTIADLQAWVEEYFVKKAYVYTPAESGWGGGSSQNTGEGGGITIINQVTVDSSFILNSPNPVESRVIQSALNNKQDTLHAGTGIEINQSTNTISCTLDTNVYMVVSSLPDSGRNPNKIYILDTVSNGEHTYSQYRWDADNTDWINIGSVAPDVDLTDYLTSADAESTYQKKSDMSSYITSSQASLQYVDKPTFNLFRQTLSNNSGYSNLMTLTVSDYTALVEHDLIDSNTYYFTYEEEEETWGFGNVFPITLT